MIVGVGRVFNLWPTALSVLCVPEGVVQVLEVGDLLLGDGLWKGCSFDQM